MAIVLRRPGLQEILKAVTARYTAEEVITKREQVREDTNALLKAPFLPQGMVIDGLNIWDQALSHLSRSNSGWEMAI
jgi:hypothetical protein